MRYDYVNLGIVRWIKYKEKFVEINKINTNINKSESLIHLTK